MSITTLSDAEFGVITLRRTRLTRSVRLTLDARGAIAITLPKRAPLYTAKRLLERSRAQLRRLLSATRAKLPCYQTGDAIGATHRLRFEEGEGYTHHLTKSELIVRLPAQPDRARAEATIHEGIKKTLRRQARTYLPERLGHLAGHHGLSYQQLRLSSARTRWGSCSSKGTISLNIWLMQLPRELIDYVIIHELCHTRQPNHSRAFWELVAACCPAYAAHRRELRRFSPFMQARFA